LANDPAQELHFNTLDEAARWFARLAVKDGLELDLPDAREGDTLRLQLHVMDEGTFGAQAKVLSVDPASGRAHCAITPRADFQELLARYSLERHSGRHGPANPHRALRFDTCLRARFRSFQQVVSEYVFNISAGGMFLRSASPPPIGTRLQVEVSFPEGELHEVQAEVVWRVEPDAAHPERAPGVGVRFLEEGPFHDALKNLLTLYLARKPRVLIVDDDAFFLRVLADGLLGHGMEVATASDGARASHLISDLLYDLDLVVLDLRMPFLDGRALLDRLRRMGGEMDLRIAVVSAADPVELASLVGPQLADDAIPKSAGVPLILERLLALAHAGHGG
jgi:uncharacterized protein (TIGR02266 family)